MYLLIVSCTGDNVTYDAYKTLFFFALSSELIHFIAILGCKWGLHLKYNQFKYFTAFAMVIFMIYGYWIPKLATTDNCIDVVAAISAIYYIDNQQQYALYQSRIQSTESFKHRIDHKM